MYKNKMYVYFPPTIATTYDETQLFLSFKSI